MKLRSPNPEEGRGGSEKMLISYFRREGGKTRPALFPLVSRSGVEGEIWSDRNAVVYFLFHTPATPPPPLPIMETN